MLVASTAEIYHVVKHGIDYKGQNYHFSGTNSSLPDSHVSVLTVVSMSKLRGTSSNDAAPNGRPFFTSV